MAEEKTVVEYDASKAMSEIAQLERRIQQLEGKTKRSFDKAAQSADNFEKSVKGVSSSAGGLVASFRNLAGGVTPFGVALGAASGGIIKLVTDIVELPPALRSTEERIKAVIDTLDRLADTAKAGIKLRGTIDTVQIEEQVKALSIRRANLQEERVEVTERRDVLKEKLAAEKDYFAQRKALAQQSGREVARLEDLAAGIREKRFLQSVAGQDLPRALDQLLSRAAQLRGKGGEENFRQAERLIDRAAGLAQEQGDFRDVSRVAAEEGRLVQAIDQVVAARKAEAQVNESAEANSRSRITLLEQEIKALSQRNTEIRNEAKILSAEATRKTFAAGDRRERQGQEEATLERDIALRSAEQRFSAQRDFGQGVADRARRGFDVTIAGRDVGGQERGVAAAREQAARAFLALKEQTADADKRAEQHVLKMEAILGNLAAQGVTRSVKFDVDNLREGAKHLREALAASEKFVQSRGSPENFRLGETNQAEGRFAEQLERESQARRRIPVTTPNTIGAPAQPGFQPQATPTAPSSTTVNINVKGGIIDPEVSRAIGDEVRRQLRRGTGPGSQ